MIRLFRRRPPEPERCEYDCRHLDAYRSASDRASARGVRVARLAEEVDDKEAELVDLRLENNDLRNRLALAQVDNGNAELIGYALADRRRAAAAIQRAEVAEKRAARLDELLARAEGRPHNVPEPERSGV